MLANNSTAQRSYIKHVILLKRVVYEGGQRGWGTARRPFIFLRMSQVPFAFRTSRVG